MQRLYRYSTIYGVLVVLISIMIITGFTQDASTQAVIIITEPLRVFSTFLKNLSLSSNLGNVLAWILYLDVSLLPMLLAFIFFRKKKSLVILSGAFTSFLLFVNYGLLNFWFDKLPISLMNEAYMQVIYFIITLIIFLFIMTIFVVYALSENNDTLKVLKLFQLFLFTIATALCVFLGFVVSLSIQQFQGENNIEVILSLSNVALQSIPVSLFILLTFKVINLFETMKVDLFTPLLLKPLQRISALSKSIVLISLLLPLFIGAVQLIFISSLQDVSFHLSIPWLEIMIALTLVLLSKILIQSIEVAQENKQFV